MPTAPYRGVHPKIAGDAFLAPSAWAIGDVEVGSLASIWFGSVLRGDSAAVRIGSRTNIQDGSIVHTDAGSPCVVGEGCTVGHRAILHACRIGDGCLIGMGAVVLSRASVGAGSLVAAGSLVLEGSEFPEASLIVGTPAAVKRELTPEERDRTARNVEDYVLLARQYGGRA